MFSSVIRPVISMGGPDGADVLSGIASDGAGSPRRA